MKRGILIYTFIALIFCFDTIAQSYMDATFEKHIDKLSEESVLSVYRDSRGFLWVGTYMGLFRSDGTDVRYYYSNPDDGNSLSSPTIYCINEDKNNNLWIGTQKGLDQFDYELDQFNHHLPADKNFWEYIEVRDIDFDNEGNLWLATYNHHGIIKYNPYKRKYNTYWLPTEGEQRLNALELNGDKLWIGSEFTGLFSMDITNHKITNHIYGTKEVPVTINDIKIGRENIWIGTWNNGLVSFNTSNNETTWHHKNQAYSNKFIGSNVRQIDIDENNNLWLAVYGNGVQYFNPFNQTIKILKNKLKMQSASEDFLSWCIHIDKEDILWFGSMETGLRKVYIKAETQPFLSYTDKLGNPVQIKSVSQAILDHNNNIWIGTQKQGLIKYDHNKKEGRKITLGESSIDGIISLMLDKNSNIWVATDDGSFIIDAETNKTIAHINTTNSFLKQLVTPPYIFYSDYDGDIWLVSWQTGLTRIPYKQIEKNNYYNIKPIYYKHIPNNDQSLLNNNVINIYQSNDSSMYISGSYFIQKFDKKTDNFEWIQWNDGENMISDESGKLWILSNTIGLCTYNPKSKDFYMWGHEHPGKSHALNIIKDDSTMLLIRKNDIIRINDNKHEALFYKHSYGIRSMRNNASLLNLGENIFFVSGNEGCYIIRLAKQQQKIENSISLSGLLVYNKKVEVGDTIGGEVILNKSINNLSHISIPPGIKSFALELTSNNFIDAKQTIFAHKLEGLDTTWTFTEYPNRLAVFNNLSAGEYTLHIAVYNPFIDWKKTSRKIILQVKTPFHETVWFHLMVSLVIFVVLVTFFIFRHRRLQKTNAFLENTVKERTSDLKKSNEELLHKQEFINEQKEEITQQRNKLQENNKQLLKFNTTKDKFFSIIAHDLKSPVGSIMGLLDLLNEGYDDFKEDYKKKMISEASNSSKAVFELIENLLLWSRTSSGKIKFDKVDISLDSIIKSNVNIARLTSQNKNIEILVGEFDNNIILQADRDMINFILRNLLSNAIKFTRIDGTIKLNVSKSAKNVTFSINDTGVGMTKDKIKALFQISNDVSTPGTNNEKGTGLGLILCKDFVKLHKGKIWVDSEPEKGSTFYITIPIN